MKWILISESIDIDQVKTYDQLIRWAKSTYNELYNHGYSDLEACSEIAETLMKNGYGDKKFWSEKLRASSIMDDGHYSRLRDLISGKIKKEYPRLNNLKKSSNNGVKKVSNPKKKVEPDNEEISIPEIKEGNILCGIYNGSDNYTSVRWCKVTKCIGKSEFEVVELNQSIVKGCDEFGWATASYGRKEGIRPYTLIIGKNGKIHQKGNERGPVFQVWDGKPKYFDIRW